MRKTIFVCCFLLLIPAFAHNAQAQETAKAQAAAAASDQPVHYYHVDFVVEELDATGKPVNSRSYTSTLSTDAHATVSIRTSARIPIVTGSYVRDGKEEQNIQYQNANVDIDAKNANEIGRQLAFNLTAHVSSVAVSNDPIVRYPVTRTNNWSSAVVIPVGKPTVVFKSDDLDSKGTMQLTVTATPIP